MNKKSPNRKYLTERNLASLRPKAKQYLVWDSADGRKKGGDDPARGLAVLISPTGTKSFRCAFYYSRSDKTQYKHLGRVGEMTLQEARTQCREVRRMAGEGDDPKLLEPHTDHFAEALRRYIENEQQGRRENKSAFKTKAVIDRATRQWQDPHHPRILSTIRYAEIEALLEAIRDGDKENGVKARPYLANRLYAHLKDFFAWALRGKLIASSPMEGMLKPWNGAKPRERDWFKDEAADKTIKALWGLADGIDRNEARYLKLLILTGKRKTALAEMRWEHIKDDWFWNAPKSEVKNKRLHGVPLSNLAQRVLHPRQKEGLSV